VTGRATTPLAPRPPWPGLAPFLYGMDRERGDVPD
jgi:hypothetical protein